jgi:tRNA(Ile)-lysidine synthase
MKAVSASSNLEEIFEHQLKAILKDAHFSLTTADRQFTKTGIAIAYSGGLDSSVLLALAENFCHLHQIPLYAFHVNHGISSNAFDWQMHCEEIALQRNAFFVSEQVCVDKSGLGVEAAARNLRYHALGKMCSQEDVSIILTGHHLDDQAETILMQLLRGTGLSGMAGMDQSNFAPTLLHHPALLLARPLLSISRAILNQYAIQHGIAYVDDESNEQTEYKRNALRHLVMPVLQQVSPGFVDRIVRAGQHARASNRILKELAQEDLTKCGNKDVLNIELLQALSQDRIDLVLRHCLSLHDVQMPSTTKLLEMRTQLLTARNDAKVSVSHANIELHRYANEIFIIDVKHKVSSIEEEIVLRWQGEESIYIPEYKGNLLFSNSAIGVDVNWLKEQHLCLRERVGGERLRLAMNRPSRSLKSHFQTNRIPFWQRNQLPLIYVQNKLMYVAALGIEAEFLNQEACELISISWRSDSDACNDKNKLKNEVNKND